MGVEHSLAKQTITFLHTQLLRRVREAESYVEPP